MKILTTSNRHQAGFITLRKLITTLILAFILYYGFWTCKFYYDYFSIKFLIRDQLREAHIYPSSIIKKKILKRIAKLGTPIYQDDMIFSKDEEKILVKITYSETLYFRDYTFTEIPFEIDEVRYFK